MDFHWLCIDFHRISWNCIDVHCFSLNFIYFHWISWIFIDFHHLGSTQEAPRRHPGAPRAPRSLQEVLGAKRSTPLSLNAKKMENMTISWSVFEGRCHQVPRLATKSIRHPPRPKGRITKGSLSKPPEPLRWKSVWGTMLNQICDLFKMSCVWRTCMGREPRGQGQYGAPDLSEWRRNERDGHRTSV